MLKLSLHCLAVTGLAALTGVGTASTAQAAATITLEQVGGQTIATGSGTLNVDALSFSRTSSSSSPSMWPDEGSVRVGETAACDFYGFGSPFPSIGSGSTKEATASSGDYFGSNYALLAVPAGYVSGDALSGTATFAGTLEDLGLTPGSYSLSWGSVANNNFDSLTITVLPEPASVTLLAIGGLLVLNRPRRLVAIGSVDQPVK